MFILIQWVFSMFVVSYFIAVTFVHVAVEEESEEDKKVYPVTTMRGMIIGVGILYFILNLFKVMF